MMSEDISQIAINEKKISVGFYQWHPLRKKRVAVKWDVIQLVVFKQFLLICRNH